MLGRKKMREILDEGAQRTGIACDTDLEAHIATLQHFGVSKLALATRWPDNVNSALTAYLKEAGIEVVVLRARGRNLDQNKVSSPLADHELALELGRARRRTRGAGAAAARRPVVRHPRGADPRSGVRQTGAAEYHFDDLGGAERRAETAAAET